MRRRSVRGLYLYCLREQTGTAEPVDVPGVDGEYTVGLIPFRDLEAVVSEVSVDEFASEEVQRKAREDIDWIKHKSLAHQRVIVESSQVAGRNVCVIPMRFGTIYKSPDNLKKGLSENYGSMRRLLEELRGKQEWSVKVYLADRDALDTAVCRVNRTIREKKEEMERLPEGLAFFMEQEIREAIARERRREIQRLCEEVSDSLPRVASDSRRMGLLGKELTGRSEPMVFNVAYLVHESVLPAFHDAVRKQIEALSPKGLSLECTGPLPPFNFSTLEEA